MDNLKLQSKPLPKTKKFDKEMAHITELARDFLRDSLPESNVVMIEDFQEFMPLFNKAMFAKLSQDEVDALAKKYYMTFSMRHPINIISKEYDPNGILYKTDGHRHRLVTTLPAAFKSVRTVNELNTKCAVLFPMLFNATRRADNPLDHSAEQYTAAIIEALKRANPREESIEKNKQFEKESREFLAKLNRVDEDGNLIEDKEDTATPSKEEPADTSCMTGQLDWD